MVGSKPEPKKHWGLVVDEWISRHGTWAIPSATLVTLYLWHLGPVHDLESFSHHAPSGIMITGMLVVCRLALDRVMNFFDRLGEWILQHVERPGIEALRRLLNRIKKGRRRGIKPSGEDN